MNLPGVGRFKIGTFYKSDLEPHKSELVYTSQNAKGMGSMDEIIKKYELTEEVRFIGHPELLEEKRRQE